MIKILFVCHGNICRSPMAEFVFKNLVKTKKLEEKFEIASAATSTEEIGNGVYPPVRELLNRLGISCKGKQARQITKADLDYYDYIILMDNNNIYNFNYLFPNADNSKVHLLMDFTGNKGQEVADPWYTRDFNKTYTDVLKGCNALLDFCLKN